MKTFKLTMLLLVVGIVAAAPARAGIKPGYVSITPFIGGYTFDRDLQLKTEWVSGLRVGYDFTDHWGMEAAGDVVSTHMKQKRSRVRSFGYRLDGLYHFMPDRKLVPFVAAGAGGTTLRNPVGTRDDTDSLINYGGGVKYFLTDALALRADVRHLHVFDGGRNDLEYTLGLTLLIGFRSAAPRSRAAGADSDGDGVPDNLDACRDTPKGAQVNRHGCPLDRDGDGVPDNLDACPDTPKGVQVDKHGCPLDGDGDDVPDYLDACPDTLKGVQVDRHGCPLDRDGDGVPDYLDACPDTLKGMEVDEHGCPPLTRGKKVSVTLEIQFDFGKADINPRYHDQMKQIADFLKAYPETTSVIEGHTDNVGGEEYNRLLSTRRAESVRRYLIGQFGVSGDRLSTRGYGFSRPIADNATPEGREKNRRIEAVFEATVAR